ncbi:MAG: hypothetical protein Roseis2KO_41710 [Roseivirga sp.]
MSGEKRTPTQILRSDLNAQSRRITNLKSSNDRLKKSLKEARNERKKDMERVQSKMDARFRSYDKNFEGLRGSIREMEREHHKSMAQQRKHYDQSLNKLNKSFNKQMGKLESSMEAKIAQETSERIEHVNLVKSWAENQLNEQRKEYISIAIEQKKEVDQLKNTVSQILAKEEANQENAVVFIEDMEKLILESQEDMPFDKYAPGELEKIERKINSARQTVQNAPQAAIATSQEAYFNLVDARSEVLRKEQEFELIYQTTLEMVRTLFVNIRENRRVDLEDNAGSLEVDYWTQGKFQQLENKIGEIKSRLEERKDILYQGDVEQILKDLHPLQQQQNVLIDESIERVVSSQIRAEMGDMVVSTLESQGFSVTESGYETNDQRKLYMIKLANRAGTEVVVVISPDDETNNNVLSVNTYGADHLSEAATNKRNESIRNALSEAGIEMGQTVCADQGIKGFYDVENLVKEGGGGVPKVVLEKAKMLNSQTVKKSV